MQHGAKMPTGEAVCTQRKSFPEPLCPPQILTANVREWCSAVRINAWAKERPTILQMWITIMYDVKYGLQSDTWYTVCTMISNCLLPVVPKLLQGLPPAVRQRLFQQDGAHALYGEYATQWLKTAMPLYLRGIWGLVLGYLAPLQCQVSQTAKVSGYMLCNI